MTSVSIAISVMISWLCAKIVEKPKKQKEIILKMLIIIKYTVSFAVNKIRGGVRRSDLYKPDGGHPLPDDITGWYDNCSDISICQVDNK